MPAAAAVKHESRKAKKAAVVDSGEKKSWEYSYNFEGMDEKMIEQRKRRIALKQLFEDMQLGKAQPVTKHEPKRDVQRLNPEEMSHV